MGHSMVISERRIDAYAKSMFSYEHLNSAWVRKCAEYLREVFGERIVGSVFLDYAFGRGNWSVAAILAGAKGVISVDASGHNVEKLIGYCANHNIKGIEVVHGNIMDSQLHCVADIIWVYGILHHIPDDCEFLRRLALLRSDDCAMALLYAYDKGSLREAIVDTARACQVYSTSEEFMSDALSFSGPARLRARDDLTAPHVAWYSQETLVDVAERAGFAALRVQRGFQSFEVPPPRIKEFSPHHLICGFDSTSVALAPETLRSEQLDVSIIREFATYLEGHLPHGQRQKFPIGLFNTHFVDGQSPEKQIIQDFLYLSYAIMATGSRPGFSEVGEKIWDATLKSNTGSNRSLDPSLLERSIIARHINEHSVRF